MERPVPFTVPYAAPAYGRPPYHMVEGRILLVTYDVDQIAASAAVSPPLEYSRGTPASAFIGDMLQLPHCGKFHEGGIVLTAAYRDVRAPYTPYLWTSTDEAMMVGREVYGMPKMLCDEATLEASGNQMFGAIHRRGREVMSIEVNIEARVDPATVPRNESRLSVRTIPDPTGEGTSRRDVLHFGLTDYTIHEAWRGAAVFRVQTTALSRAHELAPAKAIVTGYYMRVSWALDRARILVTEES